VRTLALTDDWDLYVDGSGNIATVDGPAAIAQDVASATRLFRGELWYDTTQGVPYFEEILGRAPPTGLISARLVAAGLTVPHVLRIRVTLDPLTVERRLTGTMRITDDRGTVVTANLDLPWYVNAVRGS
jgi:hypothetical protein